MTIYSKFNPNDRYAPHRNGLSINDRCRLIFSYNVKYANYLPSLCMKVFNVRMYGRYDPKFNPLKETCVQHMQLGSYNRPDFVSELNNGYSFNIRNRFSARVKPDIFSLVLRYFRKSRIDTLPEVSIKFNKSL